MSYRRSLLVAATFLGGAHAAAAQTQTPACKATLTGAVSAALPCQLSALSVASTSQGSVTITATGPAGNDRVTITAVITFMGPVAAGIYTQSSARVPAFQIQVMKSGSSMTMWMGHQATSEPAAGTFSLHITSLTPGAGGSSLETAHGTFTATVPPMQGGNTKANAVLNVTF